MHEVNVRRIYSTSYICPHNGERCSISSTFVLCCKVSFKHGHMNINFVPAVSSLATWGFFFILATATIMWSWTLGPVPMNSDQHSSSVRLELQQYTDNAKLCDGSYTFSFSIKERIFKLIFFIDCFVLLGDGLTNVLHKKVSAGVLLRYFLDYMFSLRLSSCGGTFWTSLH